MSILDRLATGYGIQIGIIGLFLFGRDWGGILIEDNLECSLPKIV